ncbi:FYN-binding protein 1 [Clarias gariepinus]|uniref:FYN-binding protein 1 n=1 Tax=Clarias gariepinus TaxID=13013 RepID=UPI00234C7647|nr:FYN-binding protein 1 [Clarias gariepinus]
MGDNVDVKALRARFHAQADKATPSGGAYTRPHVAGQLPEASDNGLPRSKLPPATIKPMLPVNLVNEPKRVVQTPQGVFPKPPPSHRVGAKEDPKPSVSDSENTRVKLTGELLQNKMMQHLEKKPQPSPRPLLPSQKSISEVAPLRKPLPSVGQRPTKPKRPPSVSLERFYAKGPGFLPRVQLDTKTHEGPPRPPKSTFLSATPIPQRSIEPEQDTYDDIDLPPPPPPPPKPSSSESWTSSFSSQADEESDHSEIYEHIEDHEGITQPAIPEKKKQKDYKRQQEVEKREQKEKLKKENEYRKKFKLTGEVEVIHTARVREDWQGGKNDLRVRQGESVEIVRVKNNPEGRWLARNMSGEYGYISNVCVDVDYEGIKRKIRGDVAPSLLPLPIHIDEDVYDDVGTDSLNTSLNVSGEVYDDIDHVIPDDFPLPPPEICQDPKKSKKLEKEEKEFRKKFKFEGPIQVICCMMVDPNANIKKASGKDLSVSKGEILEVIQQTNEKKFLCRNEQGKYGYVARHYLLHEENEIYDDIDNVTDVYDNDVSGPPPLRS